MNTLFKFFILFNLYLSNVLAFQTGTLVVSKARPYRNHVCLPKMSLNRNELLKIGAAATVYAINSVSLRKASAYEKDVEDMVGDISWTVHKGPYTEQELKDFIKTDSGLLYKDVVVGKGSVPNDGDAVTINMVGYIFETGEKWTNTYMGIPTHEAVVRAGPRENQKIMKGLNEGVKSMRKGGKRILVIPAYLAYNYVTIMSEHNPGAPIIPGGSSLVCYVEVMNFRKLD